MRDLAILHDATLESAQIDWAQGRIRLYFRVGAEPRKWVLEGSELRSFVCPRSMPWGPSVSVNAADCVDEGSARTVRIEMQSGDTLAMVVKTSELRPVGDG